MSPTEFSNYIKQRAIQQQIHHHHHHHQPTGLPVSQNSPTSRSLSPGVIGSQQQTGADSNGYFFQHAAPYHPQFPHRNIFESSNHGYIPDLYGAKFPSAYIDPTAIGHQFYGGVGGSQNSTNLGPVGSNNATTSHQEKSLVDGLNNFGLGSVAPYSTSQYQQHLLVAN